jgi:hypothetical protein
VSVVVKDRLEVGFAWCLATNACSHQGLAITVAKFAFVTCLALDSMLSAAVLKATLQLNNVSDSQGHQQR